MATTNYFNQNFTLGPLFKSLELNCLSKYLTAFPDPFQMYIKSVTLMIEEAKFLFEAIPHQLADDVAAHYRRLAEEDTSKLLDRPPQFSSVHRVQTRRQAMMHRSQVNPDFLTYLLSVLCGLVAQSLVHLHI